MAGPCGRVYRIDPRIAASECNALKETTGGLLVPEVVIEAEPGIRVTPPAEGACPAVWRVGVDGSWMQTPVMNFGHTLSGAHRAWEVVTPVPAITVPRDGVWVVDFQVRGAVNIPASASTNQAAGMTAGLYKDGVLIGGSELLVLHHTLNAGDQNTAAQTTACRQFVHGFTAGQTVQLAAARLGTTGSVSIYSTTDGRSYITMHWIGPTGDTAA
ncbi:hypothetical protein F0L17_14410 [Streptomyces sp. TRM43335]|uniref:Uncharacterized protein n=1 Tax=Streptomyces taklimakanensis TaxID=2569853 RepID=A0A6G2BDG0_9ACTN|nr:hypothetical protein [Streptomyces taklimakanensis]MTE20280.1 hypothetical protein [Streptomyces taklimakanensis]